MQWLKMVSFSGEYVFQTFQIDVSDLLTQLLIKIKQLVVILTFLKVIESIQFATKNC